MALYSAFASAADLVEDEKICRRPSYMTCLSREQWEFVNMPDCGAEDGKRVKVVSTGFDIMSDVGTFNFSWAGGVG